MALHRARQTDPECLHPACRAARSPARRLSGKSRCRDRAKRTPSLGRRGSHRRFFKRFGYATWLWTVSLLAKRLGPDSKIEREFESHSRRRRRENSTKFTLNPAPKSLASTSCRANPLARAAGNALVAWGRRKRRRSLKLSCAQNAPAELGHTVRERLV